MCIKLFIFKHALTTGEFVHTKIAKKKEKKNSDLLVILNLKQSIKLYIITLEVRVLCLINALTD